MMTMPRSPTHPGSRIARKREQQLELSRSRALDILRLGQPREAILTMLCALRELDGTVNPHVIEIAFAICGREGYNSEAKKFIDGCQ